MGTEMALGVAVVEIMRLQNERAKNDQDANTGGRERTPVADLVKSVAERLRIGVYGLRASKPTAASGKA